MASDATLAILDNAAKTYDRIRNNLNLSGDAKRTAIASAYLTARNGVDDLRTTSEASTTARIQTLSRKLFGLSPTATGADVSAFREAQEIAGNIENTSTAIAAINSADLLGDTTMGRAILGRAYAEMWGDVINAYLALNPTDHDAAQELWDLNLAANSANVMANYLEWIVPTPPELTGMSDWKITELASGATASIQVLS